MSVCVQLPLFSFIYKHKNVLFAVDLFPRTFHMDWPIKSIHVRDWMVAAISISEPIVIFLLLKLQTMFGNILVCIFLF